MLLTGLARRLNNLLEVTSKEVSSPRRRGTINEIEGIIKLDCRTTFKVTNGTGLPPFIKNNTKHLHCKA